MQNYNSKLKIDKDYDIKVRAYKYALLIMSLVYNLPQKRSVQIIADQLLRAATSIGANIIEAQAASSRRDFVNFMNHSLKSANECKFWLGLLPNELSNILAKIVMNTKGKSKF